MGHGLYRRDVCSGGGTVWTFGPLERSSSTAGSFGLAVIAVIAILPGSPLGLLALNMHSAGFLVLTAIGDVAFYTFVAHSVLARRARRRHQETEAKS